MILQGVCCAITFTVLFSWLLEKQWKVPFVLSAGVILLGMLLLCVKYGYSIKAWEGHIFLFLLVSMSASDYRTHEVSDIFWILTLCVAVVFGAALSFENILGAGFILVVELILAYFSDSVGGADIKLTTVFMLLLGLDKGLIALLLGACFSLPFFILRKGKVKKNLPLIPFFAAGSFLSYLL